MRKDLANRLTKVARILHQLKKLALTEGEILDRASSRSRQVLQKALARLLRSIDPILTSPEVKAFVGDALKELVTPQGIVNQELVQSGTPFKGLEALKKHAPQLLGPVARFMTAALMGARLQNYQRIEQAKADPRYADNLYRAQENMQKSLAKMEDLLSTLDKARENAAEPAPIPLVQEKKKKTTPQSPARDTSALEAVRNQINEAETDMRRVVDTLEEAVRSTAESLFPEDTNLHDALEANVSAMLDGNGSVNSLLNRDKGYYQDVLELQFGPGYDLGEFLDTKNKKLIYSAFRSLVMATRALGVMQFARSRPDLVLRSKKAQDLVRKAQQILNKRQKIVVSRLKKLKAEEDSREDEKGAPRGTFSELFEEAA